MRNRATLASAIVVVLLTGVVSAAAKTVASSRPAADAVALDVSVEGDAADGAADGKAKAGGRGSKSKGSSGAGGGSGGCLLYTSPSPRDISGSRMPSSA